MTRRGDTKSDSHARVWLAGMLLVFLISCATHTPAPVSDQGERRVVTPPLIVDSTTPNASLRAASGRPNVASSTAASGRVETRTATATPATRPASHRVRRGDTLFSIAYQYDLDFRALAQANGLIPPYTIFVDQELTLTVDRPVGTATAAVSTIGVPVTNNTVARAQGTSTSATGGVMRQAIGSPSAVPDWDWPLRGRVVRNFDSQTKGIDIEGRRGDPVLAASDGDVVYAGRGIQGTGELIILRHSDRYLSAYAHNSAMLVREGEHVSAGQQIAEVGENSAGTPVLHFEIRLDGQSVDPAAFLPRR